MRGQKNILYGTVQCTDSDVSKPRFVLTLKRVTASWLPAYRSRVNFTDCNVKNYF